ncbi:MULTISPECIES: YtpI family protein [Thermoactinomyces]|uniref:YtpI-like protein n=1 Tax=Thermoactinomyces daqus TaxID=1329516 RepID=A0A7W1X7P7_9BACL|nr:MULTISPECIES: YtpI family protein [Thermoactinomyces]MBA4541600.1 hypothetical protein [Thermoactinomyces daqus]MBH8597596.1 hypothetical protein [Thermoactinomyces sp. CICC 10523]MBH8603937.1 hypothetical protein [Thermoactinomyces sp. CICC 10522]MBH8606530.1 hypothetical protein [Thermoactinomyces sp. CICC 10521]
MQVVGILLICLILITIFGTFFNSILQRRNEGMIKRLYQARMNINMGVMFISIAALQLTLPGSSFLRYFLLFLVIAAGLINLYYGIKYRRYYTEMINKQSEAAQ